MLVGQSIESQVMSQPSTSNPKKKLTTNKQMLGLVTIDFQIQHCGLRACFGPLARNCRGTLLTQLTDRF